MAHTAQIDYEKTVGVYFSRWKNEIPKYKKSKWSRKVIEALGVMY